MPSYQLQMVLLLIMFVFLQYEGHPTAKCFYGAVDAKGGTALVTMVAAAKELRA